MDKEHPKYGVSPAIAALPLVREASKQIGSDDPAHIEGLRAVVLETIEEEREAGLRD